jgi:Domain of unknown function (DUF4185)
MKGSLNLVRWVGSLSLPLACGSLVTGQSSPVAVAGPPASAVGCFIQTDFVAGGKHNFELVVLEGSNAIHYWRSNDSPEGPWHKGDVISQQATAPGCLLQSDFMSGGHGNLEAVIPEAGGALVHYWRDSGNPTSGWNRTGVVTTGVTGGACFITSDFLTDAHRNFEVMVQKGDQLWHHWHTAGAPFDNWPGELVTTGVTALGPGCMIQSDYQGGGHRNFEVIVQKGDQLWHHWHWAGMAAGPWPGNMIASGITAPGCLFASDYTANNIRNFEVLVQKGDSLWHIWRWDGMTDPEWPGAAVITPVSGAGCLLQGDFSAGSHANFEVVVPAPVFPPGSAQPVNEVVHYFQVQQTTPSPWQRGQTVSYQGRSEKVCQLTSDFDWETGIPTTTSTQTKAGLGAVDLGYPVEHQGRLMLLFGDTWATQVAHPGDAISPKDDAVGWISSRTPPSHAQCTDMVVNSNPGPVFAPATVTGPLQVAQGYFNVPSGGVSDGGGVATFFWTNHCECPTDLDAFAPSPLTRPPPSASCKGNPAAPACAETDQLNSVGLGVMAHSIDGGRTFDNAVLMPNGFVYATALDSNAVSGLPSSQRLGTYIFAVPRYRASVPYLAYARPGSLGDPTSWRFFIGRRADGSPLWVPAEVWRRGSGGPWRPPGSPELFDTDRCLGEFSVTWNKALRVWLMLYNCGGRIVARSANYPWGPWSPSSEILSPDKDGSPCHLLMTDQGCGNQQRYHNQNSNVAGGFYAPYVLDRYTTGLSSTAFVKRARIYWTLSTWDPYQVSIMRTDLEVAVTRIRPRGRERNVEKRANRR